MTAIVQHTTTLKYYEFMGGNRFKNIQTGIEAEVTDQQAEKYLRFCINLSEMCGDYPEVLKLLSLGFREK